MITLQTITQEEAYTKVERMLWGLAIKFSRLRGGDVDDLFSEANVAFCKAYPKFDPDKGELTTLMHHAVWRHLTSYRMNETQKQAKQFGLTEETDVNSVVDDHRQFDMEDFLEGLSQDARVAVKLLFNSPAKLQKEAEAKGGYAKNWASSLRQLLRDMSWTVEEIKAVFDEIKEAL